MKENQKQSERREPEQRRFRPAVAITVGILLGFALIALKVVLGPQGGSTIPEPGATGIRGSGAHQDENRHAGHADSVSSGSAERKPLHDVLAQPESSAALPHGARIQCSDAENGTPLEGVHAYDLQLGRSIGVSDRNGELILGSARPGAVVLHGTGYLACLLSEAARQELVLTGRATVPVFRDRYSMELRIATEWPGQVMERGKIRILFRPADGGPEHGSGPPAARFGGELKASPELRRAWLKHTMLVDLVPHPGMVWHLGRQFDLHELPGHGGIVRFAQPGIYRVRAHDERGYVAEARSEIRSHGGSELMLSFERGRSLELLVSSAGSEVVPGARVRLIRTDGEEEEDREMQSDERGVVKFGGLFPGDRLAVEVSARGFEELNRTLPAGAKRWKVVLRPIPTVEYELTVLEAVSRKPLSGVLAVLGDPALPVRKARSGESGTLRMPLYRDRQNRLELRLAGYLDYVEIFQPGLGSSTLVACHLVPEELEHQRRLGLVCVVEGRLSDAEGHPLRGQMLSLVHEGFLFQGLPDGSRTPSRMILTGSRAEEVLRAITDTNGRFRLLSSRAGAAAVHWYGHPDATRKVVLVNGKRVLVHF